ncbi:MAG: hypothetical protein Aureis2KO_29520 [Aureisphaera sp.]
MKRLYPFLISLVLITACKETPASVEDQEVAAIQSESEEETNPHSSLIPILDFNELEDRYLEIENDTTYVVNFWATWCKPCVKELPAFEQLWHTYRDNKVKVVLVSLDFPEKIEAGVIPFIEKRGIASKVVLLDDPDANSWIPKVSEEWSGAIPATIIVTKDARKFYERSFTYEELEQEVKSI